MSLVIPWSICRKQAALKHKTFKPFTAVSQAWCAFQFVCLHRGGTASSPPLRAKSQLHTFLFTRFLSPHRSSLRPFISPSTSLCSRRKSSIDTRHSIARRQTVGTAVTTSCPDAPLRQSCGLGDTRPETNEPPPARQLSKSLQPRQTL